MLDLTPGRTYPLIPDPELQNTVDGLVTLVSVAHLGGQAWVTVSGRVATEAGVEVDVWATKPDRLATVHPGDSDPDPDEALRRVRTAKPRALAVTR